MAMPRSSSSSEDCRVSHEAQISSWQPRDVPETYSVGDESEKGSSSPLLPQWQNDQYQRTSKSRARRFCRLHLAWLVAATLFVLLMLQSTATLTWRDHLQRISPGRFPAILSPASQNIEFSGVTIVSAFFLVANGKKHTSDEYWQWIRNFLENVEQPIVFYTSPELLDRLQGMRGEKPITWMTEYSNAADMPPIQALGGAEWAQAMEWSDPEGYKHVAGVYPPWTAKPWMVQQTKNSNPYQSEYFFWADAGGFREEQVKHHFRGLPDQLDRIYQSLPDDTIVLADATLEWPEGQAGVEYAQQATEKGWMDRGDCHIQGGWYGGKAEGIDWWYAETLRITILQSMLQRFAGKEQDIWTHVARLNYRRVAIQNNFLNQGIEATCGKDPWFAYEYWADGPECEIPLWNGPAEYRIFQQALSALSMQAVADPTAIGSEQTQNRVER